MKELSNTIRRLNKLVKGVATPRPATTFDSDPVWHQQVMDRYTKGQERCMILSQLFPSEIYGINYGRIIAAHIWPKDHAQVLTTVSVAGGKRFARGGVATKSSVSVCVGGGGIGAPNQVGGGVWT